MSINLKKNIRYLIKIILLGLGIYLFLKLSIYCVPFIIAFILSALIEPMISFMERKIKIPRSIGTIIGLLIVFGLFGVVLGFIISRLINEIQTVYEQLPIIIANIEEFITNLINKANDIYMWLPEEVSTEVDKWMGDFYTSIRNLFGPIVGGTISVAISLPQALVFIIVTILATYFMSSDKKKINSFLEKQIPHNWLNNSKKLLDDLFSALFGWIRAQLIVMTITFSELFIGFLVIKVPNALLLALITAVVDALPVLGTGTVIVPWAIFSILSKNYRVGFSLLFLYMIVIVVRQLVEPKIVGKQIGIHPLLTLFSMYTGLQIIGVAGMILGPIIMILLKNIFDTVLKNEGIKDWIKNRFIALKE